MFNLTPVVKNLLLINVVVFLVQNIMSEFQVTEYLGLWSIGTSNFRPYQLFTYMFAHANFMHILLNMMGLIFTGPILESLWGQKRFIVFYVITGLGAGAIKVIIDFYFGIDYSFMIGASGAVYGLITAFGVLFPNMEVRMMFIPIGFKAKYIVLFLGGLAIYSVVMPSAGDKVAHIAHLGGIVVAIILLQFWKKGSTYN
jgi:membrane associated rhomboid family serine protease